MGAAEVNELVEFYRARLDEDEQLAQAAARLQGDPENGWGVLPHDNYAESEKRRWISPHIGMLYEAESAAHVARHDPARVLREVEARRRIVEQYERAHENCRAHPDDIASKGAVLTLLGTLKLLASVYADHEDYPSERAV